MDVKIVPSPELGAASEAAAAAHIRALSESTLADSEEAARAAADEHAFLPIQVEIATSNARRDVQTALAELPQWWTAHASPYARMRRQQAERRAYAALPLNRDAAVALAALDAHSGECELAAIALDAVAGAVEADPRLITSGAMGFAARRRRAAQLLREKWPCELTREPARSGRPSWLSL